MYKFNFHAYCGMAGIPVSFDTLEEARESVASRLRSLRKRIKVITLKAGEEWEALEPEDSLMVPDYAGTLVLKHITYACRECGFEHETSEDALNCCVYDPDYFETFED